MTLRQRQRQLQLQRQRQRQRRRPAGLGELPYPEKRGKPIDPGLGLIPEWVNHNTATNFPFQGQLVSRRIIPANPLRTYVLIQNKDAAADMFLNFGNSATAFNGVIIIPRGNYELIGGAKGGSFCPSDSIHILGAVANQNGVIIEGVLPPIIPGA